MAKLACHRSPMRRIVRLFVLLTLFTSPAIGKICKYVDSDGNVVYSSVEPGKGLRLLDCEPDFEKQTAALDAAWRVARAKVKIGMTDAQMRAADPLLANSAHRRVIESASGIDEWREFYNFTVHLHNGRVATIYH